LLIFVKKKHEGLVLAYFTKGKIPDGNRAAKSFDAI